MTDQEKELEYFKSAAMQNRTGVKPKYIPEKILVKKRVRGDGPFSSIQIAPGEYGCECNQYGAVSVKATNGQMLGLRLDEFEPLSWTENQC